MKISFIRTTRPLGRALFNLALSVGLTACLFGCREDEDLSKGFAPEINNIVPASIIADLRARGMTIHEGQRPPTLSTAHQISPYEMVSKYGERDQFEVGRVIPDYFYKFYQQSGSAIKYDYYNAPRNDVGKGTGAFIAGNGQSFTIFSEDQGVSRGIPYKSLSIISGELARDGSIKNFHYAFVIKEKTGDRNDNVLIPVNTGRIWRDGDRTSEVISNFNGTAPKGERPRHPSHLGQAEL
jgi:hypothetical protein